MTSTRHIDFDELHDALKDARRHGVKAARLLDHAPALIELLYPAADYPELAAQDRALAVEKLVNAAVDSIGGDVGHALALTLCLRPGTLGRTLDGRRQLAAKYLGISPDTWTRGWRETRLFKDLVAEIYRLHQPGEAPQVTGTGAGMSPQSGTA